MTLRRVGLLALALTSSACGDDAATLVAPRLAANWLFIASAGGGRALAPRDVKIQKATEVETVTIPGTGNVTVDMIYAGIREEDLPAGVSPDQLVFKTRNDPYTRAMPPFITPHVLEAPAPPGSPGTLVPLEDQALSDEEADYRRDRYEALLLDLRIEDPCEASDADFKTPRVQATAAIAIRVIENGGVYLGFGATSTAIMGRFQTDPTMTEEVGIDMGLEQIMPGEAAVVTDLGTESVMGPDGLMRPKIASIHRGGAIGHIAVMGATKYLDDTPRGIDPEMGRPEIARSIAIEGGEAELCVGGAASGSGAVGSGAKLAGIWCRTSTGGPWRVEATIPNAVRTTMLFQPTGFRPLALDYSGTVYARSTAGGWDPVVRPAINQDCGAVACNRLDIVATLPAGASALAVVAGDDGEAWSIKGTSPRDLSATRIEGVAKALFADEKKGGAAPISFLAGTTAPDGAVWLGSDAHFLLRVSPDLSSAVRVCRLPAEHPVTALATSPDGRLIIATSPVTVGVGTWRRP